MKNRSIRLTDIAKVERAKKGKVYPKETVYIQVSACNHNNSEKFKMTTSEGEIETKYAVILPEIQCCPMYLKEACNYFAENFFARYVGSNINIQMDSFNSFNMIWCDDIEEQKEMAELLNSVQKQIDEEEELIKRAKELKQYSLAGMFPNDR